jgi:hypothetical protein
MWKCVAALAALCVAGCSLHPLPEDVSRKSTAEIVWAIRCEAQRAVYRHAMDPMFNKAAIGYAFSFDITEDNSATAGFTLTKQLSGIKKFTLGLDSGEASLKREAKRKFTLVDTFEQLKKLKCGQNPPAGGPLSPLYPITGNIGLEEVIGTFIDIESKAVVYDPLDGKIGGQSTDFSDTLTFTTTLKTGTLAPELVLNPVSHALRLTDIKAGFSADRIDVHEVDISIALPAAVNTPAHKAIVAAAKSHAHLVSSGVLSIGVASKIAIHAEPDARARVLLILDRRRFAGQTDQLINAIQNLSTQ